MLEITAENPEETLRNFQQACDRYRDELGNSQATALRRGAIALIKSLRARTARSARYVPARDVAKYEGPGPKYITENGKTRRRWAVTHKRGTPKERVRVVPADTKAAARKQAGLIKKRGLAKQSWGWFMQLLFNRAAPRDMAAARAPDSRLVAGWMKEVVTGGNPRAEVTIHNMLGYIRAALPEAALAESLTAATNSINAQIDKGLAKARKELE